MRLVHSHHWSSSGNVDLEFRVGLLDSSFILFQFLSDTGHNSEILGLSCVKILNIAGYVVLFVQELRADDDSEQCNKDCSLDM